MSVCERRVMLWDQQHQRHVILAASWRDSGYASRLGAYLQGLYVAVCIL